MRIAAALVAALVTCAVQAADEFPAILERTSAYVAKFEQEFASIIWHETYEQIDRLPRTFGASGGRFAGVTDGISNRRCCSSWPTPTGRG